MTTEELKLKAADIVIAYVQNNSVEPSELGGIIKDVQDSLLGDFKEEEPEEEPINPEDTYTDDYITCLEDGKQVTLLKRHLTTKFGMTPEEYIEKWGLPADYPLVAKNYSIKRQQIAKAQGLGKR